MQSSGRPEAAAVIWAWRESGEGEAASDASTLRRRGTIQALVGITIGAVLFVFVSRVAGAVVATIGSVILLSALFSPEGLFAAIERGFLAFGHWVGRFLTWVLMSAIFWLFFVPFAFLFRRGRRDTMRRFYEPDAETYWTGREPERSASRSRERQF